MIILNKYAYKLTTAITTAALLASSFAGAASAQVVEISGNGSNSNNYVNLTQNTTVNIDQSNNTDVNVTVSSKANTGGNTASGNTNGDVNITTGDATSVAALAVGGSTNTATVPCKCLCGNGHTDVLISGNGDSSKNNVYGKKTSTLNASQPNNTKVRGSIRSRAKTGKNYANNNTGPGTVSIGTGVADSAAGVTVDGNTNTLNGCGCEPTPWVEPVN